MGSKIAIPAASAYSRETTMTTGQGRLLTGAIAGSLCLGFAVGWMLWGGRGGAFEPQGPAAGEGSRHAGFHAPGPREGSAGREGTKDAFARVRDDWGGGMAGQLMSYLRLVHATPVEELGNLMTRAERELPGDFPGEFVRRIIYRRMMVEDPEGLMEATMEGRSDFLVTKQGAIVRRMAKEDFDGTLEQVLAVRQPENRSRFLAALMSWRGQRDFKEAVAIVRDLEGVDADRLIGAMLERMDERGSADALEAALSLRGTREHAASLQTLFYNWSGHDRDAALAMTGEFQHAEDRETALRGIAIRWTQKEPSEAVAYGQRIESPRLRTVFADAMLSHGYHIERQEAMKLAVTIPHARIREGHVRRLLDRWSRREPAEALAWAEANGMVRLMKPRPAKFIKADSIDDLLNAVEVTE